MQPWIKDRTILRVYSGSHSYGTNTKDSDEDFRGICVPPESYFLGLETFEQFEIRDPWDEVIYDLRKFVRLALQNNPNILEALYVAKNHVVHCTQLGHEIRLLREDFLSKQVYKTFTGYAISQLRKMTHYEKNASGKRLAAIEKYGYDTKNAMHLIRLLRMGIEALTEGEIIVLRHDAKELLEIRNGKYTLTEIEEEAKRLRELVDAAYVNSKLPAKPNWGKINRWVIETHKTVIEKGAIV